MKTEILKEINEIQKKYPNLTFNNKGYEYINLSILSDSDKKAISRLNELLKKEIKGYNKFLNFKNTNNDLFVRVEFNYNFDNNNIPFYGVGYFKIN